MIKIWATDYDVSAGPRYALPTNLDAAIRHLDDQQLDRLATAVLEERSSLKVKSGQPRARVDASSLPLGKLNAARAAFKAGVTPARIAENSEYREQTCKKHWLATLPNEATMRITLGPTYSKTVCTKNDR
jgi:hypothetical protein